LFFFIGNTGVLEAEKHSTNDGEPNSSTVHESHHQKEQIVIDNPHDPLTGVTHKIEDVHITVNETTTPMDTTNTDEVKGNSILYDNMKSKYD
jgi:hypothetical protein